MLHLMFPTHLAMGYLLGIYSKLPVAYFVLGSALPDILDRSLYMMGLTAYTHTVAHSIAVAVPACAIASSVFGRRGLALAIGWVGHLAADFVNVATTQGLGQTPYFLLYFAPPTDVQPTFTTLTLPLPMEGAAHTLHPLVLLLEGTVLYWTLGAVLRDRSLPDWIRRTESG